MWQDMARPSQKPWAVVCSIGAIWNFFEILQKSSSREVSSAEHVSVLVRPVG